MISTRRSSRNHVPPVSRERSAARLQRCRAAAAAPKGERANAGKRLAEIVRPFVIAVVLANLAPIALRALGLTGEQQDRVRAPFAEARDEHAQASEMFCVIELRLDDGAWVFDEAELAEELDMALGIW